MIVYEVQNQTLFDFYEPSHLKRVGGGGIFLIKMIRNHVSCSSIIFEVQYEILLIFLKKVL